MLENILQHLGGCMRKARKECNLTQEQLSRQSGVSTRHIAKIEKGEMNPSFEILYELISCLGTPAEILFHPEYEQAESEIKELTGYFVSCRGPNDRKLILKTVQCMANELSDRSKEDEVEK